MGSGGSKLTRQVFPSQYRNDNSVKNHFYSKLRKSLRTINKIARLHLKK
jgi:DNA-binding winged helix-turn-helix (wHTH) protein